MPELAEATQEKLHRHIPGYLTVSNPVDNGGTFIMSEARGGSPTGDPRQSTPTPAVGYTVVGITGAVPAMLRPTGRRHRGAGRRGRQADHRHLELLQDGRGRLRRLVESGVPLFRSFRGCFGALAAYHRYQRQRAGFRVRPPLPDAVPEAVGAALGLSVPDTEVVLRAFGLPLVASEVTTSASEARQAAEEMGLPVAVKIASTDFPHKSDAGLVVLGLDSFDEVEHTAQTVLDRARAALPNAAIDGVEVQQMVTGGTEMIVGVTSDPTLGPAVMVGTGGVFAEVLADTAVRPLPLDEADAHEMIRSLKGFALLDGARGRPPADVDALVQTIMATATLATVLGDRLVELDLNPVVVLDRGQGAVVVDHLMILA